ncbi:MAG: hypothetical protein IPL32_01590 [Chloracidobacterium sp.]|nr:hypothetical protein [Chloracidobacterium sp.]
MKRNPNRSSRIAGGIISVAFFVTDIIAQTKLPVDTQPADSSAGIWPYVIILIVLGALGTVYYFWKQSKQSIERSEVISGNTSNDYYSNEYHSTDVDADKELEWLRKTKRSTPKTQNITFGLKKAETNFPLSATVSPRVKDSPAETKAFQEKMRMLQYAQLPINSFGDLMPPKSFEPLQISNAKALLDAIEQTNPDVEDDESVRDVSIKVLAAFRTWNSVDALSQMALYDLSASLRAKAVTVLADFDHESVFEAILLCCADPTREVRAAAARALFRLNFDRSGAWKRIIETRDEFRMRQAVRAAVESGIASKSFERLVHEDLKVAYEAFTLVALMIRAGEYNEIFDAISSHKDERVKYALLHVLKAIKDERSLTGLNDLIRDGSCSKTVLDKANDVIKSLKVTAKSAV